MFKPGETICVSPNKYGYHSVPLSMAMGDSVTLVSPTDGVEIIKIPSEEVTLLALNPIKGFRTDANCTAFRNFLVEMDYGPLDQQLVYIKTLKMPYSAAIFSGNKSIHFLISLDRDLPSEKVYRVFSEWILNVATLADPNTVNPSRSIRVPGAFREPGKLQTLVEFNGPVKLDDLTNWLKHYPEAKPQEQEKRIIAEKPDFNRCYKTEYRLRIEIRNGSL